ncbi:MAG: GNAT family N-acetyltransferase [Proteobacteria bacterium]|nr:GNAT family N-acetyltransferase [Pseudomonadota bacterium]
MTTGERPEPLPVLESPRLRLREIREGDAAALFVLHGDARVMRYWSSAVWTDPAQAQELLQRLHRDRAAGAMPWAIATRDGDALIGTVTLFNISAVHRRAEIGYALASAHWSKGLAGEALRVVLRHAFGAMQLERIEADTDPRNEPSLRMLERLGFRREGVMRRRWFVAGEWCDSAWLGLLRGDFRDEPA